MPDRYYIDTMGCQMNERDSETIAGVLQALGLQPATDPAAARVVILNTCAVREKPEHKVFSKLGDWAKLKRQRPELVIGVCGCVAQTMAEEIRHRVPAVDLILGPRNLSALREAVTQALREEHLPTWVTNTSEIPVDAQPAARAPGLSAFVNIMYGCNNFCAYCIVPYARGREVSRPAEDVLAEVRQVVGEGYREVTLLGQNVNSYDGRERQTPWEASPEADPQPGRRLEKPPTARRAFPALLREVGALDGLWRLRFTTSHPKDLSEELLRAMAETPTVCEHLHLPLQAGDDEVLARMGRGYTLGHYLGLVERARQIMPGLSLTTDVMVGFPGETEAQFGRTLAAFEAIRYDQAFMFKYSDRPGTAAEGMPDKVDEAVKQARLLRLVALQNRIAREVNQAQEGLVFEVLVEGRDEKSADKWRGRTRQNKIMVFTGGADLTGQLVPVRAAKGYLWGYVGEATE